MYSGIKEKQALACFFILAWFLNPTTAEGGPPPFRQGRLFYKSKFFS